MMPSFVSVDEVVIEGEVIEADFVSADGSSRVSESWVLVCTVEGDVWGVQADGAGLCGFVEGDWVCVRGRRFVDPRARWWLSLVSVVCGAAGVSC